MTSQSMQTPCIKWTVSNLTPDEFPSVPIDSDIVVYAIWYGNNNFVIHYNDDCTFGCFYLPFIKLKNYDSDIDATIRLFIKRLKKYNKLKTCKDVLFHVFETKDQHGNRYVAIGATNKNTKDDAIKKLNIKTLNISPSDVQPLESWLACIDELAADPNSSKITEIEFSDILEFEKRQIVISHIKHLYRPKASVWHNTLLPPESCVSLLLQKQDSPFYAVHFDENSAVWFYCESAKSYASIFNLATYRMTSMEEINNNVKTMIESFRIITGFTRCKTLVQFCEISPSIYDVSMATVALDIDPLPHDEEQIIF